MGTKVCGYCVYVELFDLASYKIIYGWGRVVQINSESS